jgi:hypothetical protein
VRIYCAAAFADLCVWRFREQHRGDLWAKAGYKLDNQPMDRSAPDLPGVALAR